MRCSLRWLKTTVDAGIAYDKTTGRVFVTGKYWPRLYSIKPRLTSANPNAFELLSVRHSCIKSSAGV